MDLPLGQLDMFCQRLNTLWRRRARTDQRWAEGVGAGGGQLGSSARARRSLAVDSLVSFMSPLGARLEATQDGGGSQPEERHGVAAEGLRIIRRRKKPGTGGFWKIFPYPTSFVARRLDPYVRPTPSLVGTRLLTGCLRQCA
jgi:hypothetical protein